MRKKCAARKRDGFSKLLTFLIPLTAISLSALAQSGEGGITAATTEVHKYFDVGIKLMYTIGAVIGIIGAVKVFQKWNSGDQDTSKVATAWFASCIFLLVVATILKGFFGV